MPARVKPTSVESEALYKWKVRGAQSPLLDARVKFMEVEGTARYIRMLQGVPRVHPNMLPTQASGRWSTTRPPLVNFPPDCVNPQCPQAGTEHAYATDACWSARDIVAPDPGWYWLHYDLDAIEAKWAAADAGDQDDLQAFNLGHDIHTIRTCRALGRPLPPVLTKALHTDPSCQAWRDSWDPPWSGGEDRRRHVFKTVGYACVPLTATALTRDGWKSYNELKVGESVLTYNANTNYKEWQPIREILFYPEGEVWQYENNKFLVQCTEDHRWFTRPYVKATRHIDHSRGVVTKAKDLTQTSNIIQNAAMWPDTKEWDVDSIPPKYSTNWVRAICQMSSTQRKAFLAGFLIADGYYSASVKGRAQRWVFSQVDGPLWDAALTAAYIEHPGRIATAPPREGRPGRSVKTAFLSAKQHVGCTRLKSKKLPGVQPVWCIVTDNGSWVMRQNDTITITGNTQFCVSPKGALQAKGVDKLGLTPDELLRFVTRYLASKPVLMNRKRQVWDESAKTGVSYTWFGRRRRLYGDWATRAKEGWSHRISGTVSDYQNQIIVQLDHEFPEGHLVLNSHDGLVWAFPEEIPVSRVMGFLRPLVEKDVTSPTGHTVKVTAAWEVIRADLSREAIRATV